MSIIDKEYVIKLLVDNFSVQFDLADVMYFKSRTRSSVLYSYSAQNIGILPNTLIRGILLIEQRDDRLILFPSIDPILPGLPEFQVSNAQVDTITHGKAITAPSLPENMYRLIDKNNHFLAIAVATTKRLEPIADLGVYLREENY